MNSKYCCEDLAKRNKSYKKGVMDKVLIERLIGGESQAIAGLKELNSPQNPSSPFYKLMDVLEGLKQREN